MRNGAPDLGTLIKTLSAQEAALSELTALNARQADTIGGVIVVLRALIDMVLDEEQRGTLEMHLSMTVAGDARRSKRAIIDALLD